MTQHGHHQRRRMDDGLLLRSEMPQQRGHGHRARAGAVQVDVVGAGDLAHGVDRFKQRGHVGVHVPVALRRGGIAPAHDEGLQAAVEHVLDDAPAGRDVEDVELVDLRRHDQLRPAVDLGRRGRVLDQLQHVVAKDDGPRRQADVLADLEGPLVDLGRHAAVFDQVRQHVAQAAQQARATAIDHLLHRRRIARQRVRRRQRLGQHRHREARARLVVAVHRRLVDEAAQRLPPGHIALVQPAVERVGLPRRIGEALVALAHFQFGLPRQHRDQLAGQDRLLLEQQHGLLDGLQADLARRREDIAPAQADEGIRSEHALGRTDSQFVDRSDGDRRGLAPGHSRCLLAGHGGLTLQSPAPARWQSAPAWLRPRSRSCSRSRSACGHCPCPRRRAA